MLVNSVSTGYVNPQYSVITSKSRNTATTHTACQASSANNTSIQFSGFFSDLFTKKFNSAEEKQMYNELKNVLHGKDKTNFDQLYTTGKLLNTDSNDGSSTLQNLYKIYKEPRIAGLDNEKLLSDTLERIANPFIITQKFGKIPNNISNNILSDKQKVVSAAPNEPKSVSDIEVENSSSCVAASVEFSLADKKPAEFARFVEGLSSPNIEVNKKVKISNLNKNIVDALSLLKMFDVASQGANWDTINIKIAPDRDAIVRARVQNTHQDKNTRSCVDVLMQSAFMQLGSQNTYNSLTDKRYGSLNSNDTGLTEFEKTFVESIVNNDGEKTSVVYQNVNDNSILEGSLVSPETIKQQLISTIDSGKNVIIGITETDANKKIIGGHEITLTKYNIRNNKLYFIYNDTDDDYVGPIEVSADVLIPKIHHAGIPVDVLHQPEEQSRGKQLLKEFEEKNKSTKAA